MKKIEVYAIPLDSSLGYGYVEIHSIGNTQNQRFLRIYDYYSIELETYSSKIIENGYVYYEMLLMGKIPNRGEGKWLLLGELETTNIYIPSFKSLIGPLLDIIELKDWSTLKWHVIRNFDTASVYDQHSFKDVADLGIWIHSSPNAIRRRISFFWIINLKKNIWDYYDPSFIIGAKNTWNRFYYNEVNNFFRFGKRNLHQ